MLRVYCQAPSRILDNTVAVCKFQHAPFTARLRSFKLAIAPSMFVHTFSKFPLSCRGEVRVLPHRPLEKLCVILPTQQYRWIDKKE